MEADLQMEVLEKRRKLEVLRKRRQLVQDNGLAFFRPHHKQHLFYKNAGYRRRYARTGNRFGKSDLGAAEDCSWAYGKRLWYESSFDIIGTDGQGNRVIVDRHEGYPGHPLATHGIPQRPTKGCIIVQDWDKAHEIFTSIEQGAGRGKLFRFLPKDAILSAKKGRSGTGIAEIHVESIYGGTSTIHMETVRSFTQNPMGLESSDWDWVHIDEPCPYDMWVAVSRGLVDRAGSAWFTCTPLAEPWINDYFIPRSRTRSALNEPLINEQDSKFVMSGSMRDNPYLKKEAIDAFEADLTEEEKQCRLSGIPLALSGLIYKDFSRDAHIYSDAPHGWKDPGKPPKSYTIRVLIDPHPKTPHAVLFFATAPTGQTFIYHELFRPGLISELTDHILAVTEGYHVEDYLVDPIAFIENPITGSCMADEFYACGLPVVPAVKDLSYGVLKTQAKWRERDNNEIPTLFVNERLDEFLFEIDRYIWDTAKNGKSDKEKPIDKDDHMMECLYRAVLTGLTYVKESSHDITYTPPEVKQQSWNGPKLRELTSLRDTEKKPSPRDRRMPA